jgi:hypothetical protein
MEYFAKAQSQQKQQKTKNNKKTKIVYCFPKKRHEIFILIKIVKKNPFNFQNICFIELIRETIFLSLKKKSLKHWPSYP